VKSPQDYRSPLRGGSRTGSVDLRDWPAYRAGVAIPDLPAPPRDARLLPAVEKGAFLDMWGPLPDLARLLVPVGLRSQGSPEKATEAQVFDHIDTRGSIYQDGQRRLRIGTAVTDARLVKPDVVLAALPTDVALRRYFHAEQLEGLAWNPCDAYSAFRTTGHVLYRFGLPRLIGFVGSPDRLARTSGHADLARGLLRADRVCAAHYHAVAARESGAPLEEHYFTELDTLRRLGLWEAFQSYHGWYGKHGGRRLKVLNLYSGAALIMAGQPDYALGASEAFLQDPDLAGRAWLERGRALIALKRAQEAVTAFDRALALEPDECETLLGKGIALRTLHWEPANREGLLQAAACFRRVREVGDESVPEATHHLATIHLALGDWVQVEALSREAQRLRKSPVSRRNLCLALHAQGREGEAYLEYEFLREHAPQEAAPLHKYFEGKMYLIERPSPPKAN
jgi:tetratricopeptide (TPR) repeat protein